MASLTNIFISITVIIAIGGEAAIVPLTLPGARVFYHEKASDTRSILTPIGADQDKFNMTWPFPSRAMLDVETSPMAAFKTDTESTVSQHENQKEQRPEPVKTTGADDAPGPIMSPIDFILPFNEDDKGVIPPTTAKPGMKFLGLPMETIEIGGIGESKLKTRYRRSAATTSSSTNGTAVEKKQELTKPSIRFKLKCFYYLVGTVLTLLYPDRECMQYYLDPTRYYS